ncbi:hypothetical protein Tco_0846179 [Tanacetum coccineum]
MRITRNHQPLNLTVYDKVVLKMLGFSEWMVLHDLGSNVKIKSNDQLLKNLKEKFQWVATQAKKLGIPPPPELTTFELPSAEKKTNLKKREVLKSIKSCKRNSAEAKEMFNKLNFVIEARNDVVEARKIVLDNLDNLAKKLGIPPLPELTTFELPSAEKKTNLKKREVLKSIKREEEFHLATTPVLIRIQNVIKKNSAEAKEMYNKLNFVIEARNDIVEARKIVLDNLDNLAGMKIEYANGFKESQGWQHPDEPITH